MKIRIQTENLLERIALYFNLAPLPLVHTQVYFNAARIIMAGSDTGVFEAIGKSALTAAEIAVACHTHPAATAQLLQALTGIGYLKYNHGRYTLKRRYRKWLLSSSEVNVAHKLAFQVTEWEWMNRLDDFVRTGKPIEMHNEMDAETWAKYQEGMRDLSISTSQELARKIKLEPRASAMLDIGGSHGLYSIALCRRYNDLKSTILELTGALPQASSIAHHYGMQDRISYREGNALTDDLGEGLYDLVMINNLVHHFTDEENRELAGKVYRALKPGGFYAIGDFVLSEKQRHGDVVAATTGLYFALTSASGVWPLKAIQQWQSEAGLRVEKPIKLLSLPGWIMSIGRK